MSASDLASILSLQTPAGAFPSVVRHSDGSSGQDENGFVTALVLRELGRAGISAHRWSTARDRALNFLEQCRSCQVEGAFGFWPEARRPQWAVNVPPDIDDTALAGEELRSAGRLDSSAQWDVIRVLSRARVERHGGGMVAWVRQGAFATWIGAPGAVDCCANANVVAFLVGTGMEGLPGVREAIQMIGDAIEWSGSSWARLVSVSPFYAHPSELRRAIDHAVAAGATELSGPLDLLERRWGELVAGRAGDPVCCSAYGGVVWRAPALDTARRLNSRPTSSSD
jgi:hypothetical protein